MKDVNDVYSPSKDISKAKDLTWPPPPSHWLETIWIINGI